MNAYVHRGGLAVALLATVITVGGFLAVDGYLKAQPPAAAVALGAAVAASSAPADDLAPEIVYVRPAPSPEVIHVTQNAPPAPRKVVKVVVPSTGGEPGEGEDGGEDD